MRITTYKLELVKENGVNYGGADYIINCPDKIRDFLVDVGKLDKEPEEVLVLVCLNTKNKIVGYHEVSRGTLNSSLFHPREVFKRALLNNSNSIMIAHNHPSGSPKPSREDNEVTKRLKEAGELMEIKLLDHIIIGEDGDYYSYKAESTIL